MDVVLYMILLGVGPLPSAVRAGAVVLVCDREDAGFMVVVAAAEFGNCFAGSIFVHANWAILIGKIGWDFFNDGAARIDHIFFQEDGEVEMVAEFRILDRIFAPIPAR